MTLQVVFTRGISASGKSTYAKQLCKDGTWVRANMDDIRTTLGLPFSSTAEKLALRVQDQIILGALRVGQNVVVDNLHLHKTWPRRLAILIWEANISVEYAIKDFTDVDLNTCIDRNNARHDNHGVGDAILQGQFNKSKKQAARWTVDDLIRDLPEIVPVEAIPGRKSVIFDIDGTIAEHVARGPYDMELLHTDRPFAHVSHLVNMYHEAGWAVILCSGREEKWRRMTCQWLDDHSIHADYLYMRPSDDQRRDSLIKLELHDQNIRGKFSVQLVYDDRDRVVNVWRALGYPCLQVAPGDF